MVREMRVPSSSSSSSIREVALAAMLMLLGSLQKALLTDCDGLYPNAFLNMGIDAIVVIIATG